MRLISVILAIVVAAGLYMFVFERDRLLEFARGDAPQPEVAEEAAPLDAAPIAEASNDDPSCRQTTKARETAIDPKNALTKLTDNAGSNGSSVNALAARTTPLTAGT